MATLMEERALFGCDDLRGKVEAAIVNKAYAILQEATPGAVRKAWAVGVFTPASVRSEAERFLLYLLAANAAFTPAQITGATDATLSTKISDVVDRIYPIGV